MIYYDTTEYDLIIMEPKINGSVQHKNIYDVPFVHLVGLAPKRGTAEMSQMRPIPPSSLHLGADLGRVWPQYQSYNLRQ